MADYPIAELSDEELVTRARSGDAAAYGQLWSRHAHAGLTVARHVAPPADADDLVVEAFIHILEALRSGHGPTFAFRPYLYATIRNQAQRWGHHNEISLDYLDDLEAPADHPDPLGHALDSELMVRAFRTLPLRWQSVLWYTEVEGMDPHEVAPLLGLTANSAASLAFRARDGLRSAWVQMHIEQTTASPDCRWARAHLGDFARNRLTRREERRLRIHLTQCEECAEVGVEAKDVAGRLAIVLVPLLGTAVGSSLAGQAESAAAAGVTAGVAHLTAGSGSLAGTAATASAAQWAVPAIAAGVAALTAVAAFVIPATDSVTANAPSTPSSATVEPSEKTSQGPTSGDPPDPEAAPKPETAEDSVAPLPPVVSSPVEGALIATGTPELTGDGEPGAVVAVRVGGAAVAQSLVSELGQWAITLPRALSDGPATLTVTASDSSGNESAPTSRTFSIDTVALPPTVTLVPTADGFFAPSVSGLGEPGAVLQLSADDGTGLCSATVDPQGLWACAELLGLATGDHSVSASQTDRAGNVSASSVAASFSIAGIDVALAGSGCSPHTPCNVKLTGAPNALVRVLLDGVPQVFDDHPRSAVADYAQVNPGGQAMLHLDVGTGQHSVAVYYISATSSAHGSATSIDFTAQ